MSDELLSCSPTSDPSGLHPRAPHASRFQSLRSPTSPPTLSSVDLMATRERFYAALPVWGQNLAVTLYGRYWKRLRFGGDYDAQVAAFRERDTWSADRWASWQRSALTEVLSEAASEVPHYRGSWSPEEKVAAAAGDLSGLPLLEKEPLRRAPEAFINQARLRPDAKTFHTSGTSGTPIAAAFTPEELRATMAVREVRSAGWADVSFEDPRATFSGRIVVPDAKSRGPFHRFNQAEKQVYFSAFHLSPNNAARYVQALHDHETVWLTGYAVSSYLLARSMIAQNLPKPPHLRAIVTTSEKLEPAMRETVESAFGCPAFEEYSTVENASFASECEHHCLHVSPDVGIIEILDENGLPCRPGEVGEVVVTSIVKRLQPLVRFRLGDLASWSAEPCPCGRALPVLQQVVGRVEDVIRTADGRETVRFHGVFTGLSQIVEAQVVQTALDHLAIHVVASTFDTNLEREIIRRVHERLGEGVRVDVVEMDSIPRSASGKFQPVISKIERTQTFGHRDLDASQPMAEPDSTVTDSSR